MLVNRLTAKLMNRLTAKLVVVNLVKLHLTKSIFWRIMPPKYQIMHELCKLYNIVPYFLSKNF